MTVSAQRVPVRAGLGFWLGAIILLCSGLAAAAESDAHALARGSAEPAQTQAVRAFDFVQAIGVVTHVVYTDTAYADIPKVQRSLAYLGVTHLRDALPSSEWIDQSYLAFYKSLVARGYRFTLVPNGGLHGKDIDIDRDIEAARKIMEMGPGAVAAIEGFNEVNNWPVAYQGQLTKRHGAPGYEPSARAMRDLYNAVKRDPVLRSVPVFNLTGGEYQPTDVGLMNIAGHADYANAHVYPEKGEQPAKWIARGFQDAYTIKGDYSKVMTEAGYYTMPHDTQGWGGVDEPTQATMSLNFLFDAWNQGVSRIYLYELLDELPEGDMGNHFGLFRYDGTPKPVATAIHNLTTILADTGAHAARFPTDRLPYSVRGLPPAGKSMLLQKSSGVFQIVVWNEPKVWNAATKSPVETPATPVTVDLGGPGKAVRVYDPLRGAAPVKSVTAGEAVAVSLTDHPLVIEVGPLPAASPGREHGR